MSWRLKSSGYPGHLDAVHMGNAVDFWKKYMKAVSSSLQWTLKVGTNRN